MNSSANTNARIPARPLDRRSFLYKAGLIAAATPAAAMLLGVKQDLSADTLPYPRGTELDIAVLNFALNLEYLEGEYYNLGAYGKSLSDLGITLSGSGTQGSLTVKDKPQVSFDSSDLQQYAEEIANDEAAHIKYLQTVIKELGGMPIAEPSINLLDSFNQISNAAGLSATFDPFANETNFFLGGFSLTDVGVTAYHGGSAYLTSLAVLSGAAGILATECYHDAVLRLTVYQAGTAAQKMAQAISTLRDKLDGSSTQMDQGVLDSTGAYNLVPADENSIAFSRKPHNVINIVCGATKAHSGGFFPSGLNGAFV